MTIKSNRLELNKCKKRDLSSNEIVLLERKRKNLTYTGLKYVYNDEAADLDSDLDLAVSE